MKILNKLLSSKFVNFGIIGRCKDYIYYNYISPKKEGKTDLYRKEILNIFNNIYDEEKWILAFGSALRFYRDRSMDGQDIDILISHKSFDKKKDKLKKEGFLLKGKYLNRNNYITEYKLMYKDVEIDIFFVEEDEKNNFWVYSTFMDSDNEKNIERSYRDNKRIVMGKGYCSYKEKMPDFECEKYNFCGFSFKSYKNMEKHLEYLYGPTWKTPDSHFYRIEELKDHFIILNNAYAEFYDKPHSNF